METTFGSSYRRFQNWGFEKSVFHHKSNVYIDCPPSEQNFLFGVLCIKHEIPNKKHLLAGYGPPSFNERWIQLNLLSATGRKYLTYKNSPLFFLVPVLTPASVVFANLDPKGFRLLFSNQKLARVLPNLPKVKNACLATLLTKTPHKTNLADYEHFF